MARSAPFLAIAAAVLLAGAVGLIGLRQKPSVERKAPESAARKAPELAVIVAPSAVAAAEPAVHARPSPGQQATPAVLPAATLPAARRALDERSLMATLRDLRGSDPNRTLELAREGNQRFPGSPDVAERSWVIVKSLSDLGRHDEARVEGRLLVERYRDTRWAEDVYRHLFVNPPTHPFERGYGKELEGE